MSCWFTNGNNEGSDSGKKMQKPIDKTGNKGTIKGTTIHRVNWGKQASDFSSHVSDFSVKGCYTMLMNVAWNVGREVQPLFTRT